MTNPALTKPPRRGSKEWKRLRKRANEIRSRKADPKRNALSKKKNVAKIGGLPFDDELMRSIPCPDTCPALGTPISFAAGEGHRDPRHTASYDQIIPGRGYVVGNVVVLSKAANTMKSNATPHELLRFAQWIISEYGYLLDTAPPV